MAGSMSLKKKVALLLTATLVAVAGLQLFQPEMANPPEDFAINFENVAHPSPELLSLVESACYDCHSHRTRWPWYAKISPVSWIMAGHVEHGRNHLNFSEWGKYSPEVARMRLQEACEEVREGHMPPPGYRMAHPEIRLTKRENDILCKQ